MGRLLRVLGQTLLVVAITLVLDFVLTATVFSDIKRDRTGVAEKEQVYKPVLYHHDLQPNVKATRLWGNLLYPWETDRYGFRIGKCAPGEAEKGRKPIFVIGNSFTEAVGITYEKSFAGLMACDAERQQKAVWNLGVTSYSPAIYHHKIRVAAEKLAVKPAEIFVFLDLSDIDDEANVYRPEGDIVYSVDSPKPAENQPQPTYTAPPPQAVRLGRYAEDNFSIARVVHDLYLISTFSYSFSLDRPRARWSLDPVLMEKWGKKGLDLAGQNLDRIVAQCREWQCRLTLVVYPWPDNVKANDRDSIQVRHWRAWSAERNVRFIDGFAPFFREPEHDAIRKILHPRRRPLHRRRPPAPLRGSEEGGRRGVVNAVRRPSPASPPRGRGT